MPNRREAALRRALKKVRGPARLASFISQNFEPISVQAVSQWKRCPATRAIQVEQACAGAVTRHELRPDLYPLGGSVGALKT